MVKPTLAQLTALQKRDPKLKAVLKRLGPYPGFPEGAKKRQTHFESLTRAIVFQQLAYRAADTIYNRACALTPGDRFPRAAEICDLSLEQLRSAGLSRAKSLALKDLSERIVDGDLKLRSLGRYSDEVIIEKLIQVRGIGAWTAQMFLMFKLGRLDVLPAADLGVQEGLRVLDKMQERPTAKELEARGAVWAPLSSVAAWLMWRLADEAKQQKLKR
ncbi:MAG: DNA-3-methyladenine glycosylase 2 family protein [Planctomycetota bacterium]|jgi:DNA-3-methyladenine glycosylase II|nr:DNA-3-methyladenine glycosylase 2 family protein [Planctomycetota bacterium]